MDAVKFIRERMRMLKAYGANSGKSCSGVICGRCPFFVDKECFYNQEKAVEIVEKWSKENPQKTIKQDFLEKYPNAKTDSKGEPKTCCVNLGYKEYDECDLGNCNFCWNRPLEG